MKVGRLLSRLSGWNWGAALAAILLSYLYTQGQSPTPDPIHERQQELMPEERTNSFSISLFPLPSSLNPTQILSASHYIIADHLIRPLIRLTATGAIQGDLAVRWTVSSDYKSFKFKIDPDARFSDGSSITVNDVIDSIELQRTANTAVHFNFSEILSVTAPSSDELAILLRAPNPSFLLQLISPEFGVYHYTDIKRNRWSLTSPEQSPFKVTSGPYSITSVSTQGIEIAKNSHYPNFEPTAPTKVQILSTSTSQQVDSLRQGKLQFAIPFSIRSLHELNLTEEDQAKIKVITPPIGFTYWLSINPHSKIFTQKSIRNHFQHNIRKNLSNELANITHPWSLANQLYLPDGLGRPTNQELEYTWKQIETNAIPPKTQKKISVLLSSHFPFNSSLIKAIRSSGYDVETEEYQNQDQFNTKAFTNRYDAFLINNDFSSLDLLSNLLTTFHASRPLIWTTPVTSEILNKAKTLPHGSDRNFLFSKISTSTLREGLIVPLVYNRLTFLHSKAIDISLWSKIFPEISLWKIKNLKPSN